MSKLNTMYFQSAEATRTDYICSVECGGYQLSKNDEDALLACHEIFNAELDYYESNKNENNLIRPKTLKRSLNKKNSKFF